MQRLGIQLLNYFAAIKTKKISGNKAEHLLLRCLLLLHLVLLPILPELPAPNACLSLPRSLPGVCRNFGGLASHICRAHIGLCSFHVFVLRCLLQPLHEVCSVTAAYMPGTAGAADSPCPSDTCREPSTLQREVAEKQVQGLKPTRAMNAADATQSKASGPILKSCSARLWPNARLGHGGSL